MIAINLDGDRVKTYKVKVLATTFATLKIFDANFVQFYFERYFCFLQITSEPFVISKFVITNTIYKLNDAKICMIVTLKFGYKIRKYKSKLSFNSKQINKL